MFVFTGSVHSAPGLPNESDFGTSSEISVADLLNIVKDMPEIASILSKDVAERLGIERPYNAKITDNLKYSLQPPTESLPDVGEDAELSAQVATDKDAKAALQMVQKLYNMATQGKGYLGDVTGEAAIQPEAWKNRLQDVADKLKKETGTDHSDKYIRNSLFMISLSAFLLSVICYNLLVLFLLVFGNFFKTGHNQLSY